MNQLCRTKDRRAPAASTAVMDEASDIRVDKVLEIRRQLQEGTYSLADRLDVVVERIIEDLS